MVELLQSLVASNQSGRPVLGLGVSVPGLVDEEGRILTAPRMPGWRHIGLSQLLEERMGMPVFLDSESRVQAIAEGWFGQGRGVDNFVCLEAGVGLSADIVITAAWRGTTRSPARSATRARPAAATAATATARLLGDGRSHDHLLMP